MTFVGAVLTGGASRRMGADKATLVIGGVAMAARVAAALRDAGAVDVAVVGLPVEGEHHVADRHPGAGPLGGVLSALAWSEGRRLVVAPCDLLTPDPAAFGALAGALETSGALAAIAGLDDPLPVALRAEAAGLLEAAFAAGERSLRGGVAVLDPIVVDLPGAAIADADTRDELPPGAG